MTEPVIRIEGLSKSYQIGSIEQPAGTLAETLVRRVAAPLRRAGALLSGNAAGAADLNEEFHALTDVSFEVAQGEVLGVVGRNGAGKTTLLRILSGITEPTKGDGYVKGRVGSLLEVGTGFHPELTGRENIYLNGAILGMRRNEIKERFDEIVEFAGVQRFLETPVKHYSSGMYLRLAFAVAAHLAAEILLVDEVLAVGDAEFQQKCLSKMQDVSHSGRTVLFVSHNMAAVENLCSRAIWLDGGRLVRDDTPETTIPEYLGTYATASAGADLTDYPHRRGTGKIRYKRIEYLGADGRTGDIIRAGDPLRLRLTYEVHEPVLNPHFGVKFDTAMGTQVWCPNTWGCGYNTTELQPGEGTVELSIDNLYLMPGRYYVSLWTSPIGQEVYDDLDRCSVLDVQDADFYGSGRGAGRHGVTFLPCSWNVEAKPDPPASE